MSRENNCPFCGSVNKIVIGKPQISKSAEPYIRNDYRIVRCLSCRFYFVNPRIDLTFDEWSRLYGNEYFSESTAWHKKQRLRDLKKRFGELGKKSRNKIINFLDVGCGEGLALIESEERNWNTYGLDITDNRIMKAKDPKIKFIKGELLTAGLPADFFDAVYMDSVLEHLINPHDYLKELNKILKPGGVIYIGVPNEDSLFNDFKRIIFNLTGRSSISEKINPFKPSYHVSGFTKKSLRIASERAGFSIIKIRNFAARFEFMKYDPFSRGFIVHFLTLPVDLAAILLRREAYLEAYLTK